MKLKILLLTCAMVICDIISSIEAKSLETGRSMVVTAEGFEVRNVHYLL